MPLDTSFQKVLDQMTKEYGEEKGKDAFWAWVKKNGYDETKPLDAQKKATEHVSALLPFRVVLEKISDKPLRIRGVAMTAGMSRNFNIYTPEELQAFTDKLVSAPVYIEHVAVPNAVGKVTKTDFDGHTLWYEAEIYDEETAEKIRAGLVQHVSVGADYDAIDIVDGKVPHGLHNAELSLVAVPGIPEANIQVLERLRESLREQGELCSFCGKNPVEFWVSCCFACFDKLPLAESKKKELREKAKLKEQAEPQEFVYVQLADPQKFLEDHFSVSWVDQTNGIQGMFGVERESPGGSPKVFALLFMRAKGWDLAKAQAWLVEHPQYSSQFSQPAGVQVSPVSPSAMGVESLNEEELEKLVEAKVKEELDKRLKEAEWDTAYINNLPDEAFAYISPGGQKDGEGKTVPRSLRNLPYKNAEGKLDADHVRNALARLDQTDISAEAKAEATKKLCTAAKELNIASAVCGLTNSVEALQRELVETKGKLTDAEKQLKDLKEKQGVGAGLVKPPPADDIINKQEILECIPDESIIRSWKAPGAVTTIRKILLKLTGRATK